MLRKIILPLLLISFCCRQADAADWPLYRGDASRTGRTAESLPEKLSVRWVHRSSHAPRPAWPRSERMPFDRAYQAVVADGRLFFGSSVDGAVYALSTETGRVQWSYYTDAPIRFAPAIWKDRVIVASDDGFCYCLAAKDGALLWKHRGGKDESAILGNQQLISKWPARGGPTIVDDKIYYAAGIWPSDGIFLYALDARSGKVLWKNDQAGAIYMAQPHGGANAKSGISAQGYLVVSKDKLFVPTGRAVPASFDRTSGEFLYYHLQKYGHDGGAPTMAIGDMFFNSGLSFGAASGERIAKIGGGQLAATEDGLVQATGKLVSGYQWVEVEKPDRKGKLVKSKSLQPLWSVQKAAGGASLITAGDKVVSGGKERVDLIDPQQQKVVWSADVEGVAYGLAAADGKLFVSTDQGVIYCFDQSDEQITQVARETEKSPYGDNEPFAKAAEEILRLSDASAGYCIDLGCGDGRLAYELAKRTELQIYAIDDDPKKVAEARRRLTAAGIYGSRVIVQHRNLKATGYPKYLANLIVSGRSITDKTYSADPKEAARLQRPYGGVVCIGPPGAMQTNVRGKLKGAGSWTHQYANASNTLNSDDTLIKGRLSMLWFRDISIDVPSRHGRAPAPLFYQGRLFHEGIDGIVAVDAYNGTELWRYDIKGVLKAYDGDELMGTAGTGSNFCIHGESLYIRDRDRCLRLSAIDGTLLGEFKAPPQPDGKPGQWGYIACVDGVLYGSVANQEHIVTYRFVPRGGDMSRLLTESQSVFAMNAETGELLWRYDAKDSIRHNTLAIGGGKVYLIDRLMADFDRVKKSKIRKHPTGVLIALDAKTGKKAWEESEDIYGTMLAVSEKHNALLMSYQPTRFRLDSEVGGRITLFASDKGKKLWEVKARYQSRPMINDRTIYTQGGAWDLLSGEPRPFPFARSYGCGILAGSRNMMLFRSATLGYFDLTKSKQLKNSETQNFGGVRPGCWVNILPVGGVVLAPDASAGCVCSYQNKSWIALDSIPVNE